MSEQVDTKAVNLTDTFDATLWVKEWLRIIKEHPSIPTDEGAMIGWFANAIMAGYDRAKREDSSPEGLTASEALYGFAGWLTSREKKITMSSTDDAAAVADLVNDFCAANALADPRAGWSENLIYPKGPDDDRGAQGERWKEGLFLSRDLDDEGGGT